MATQRTVLVTGGTRGLGLETCRQLAAQGYRVLLTGRTLEAAEARVGELDGELHALQLDVTDEASRAACAEAVQGQFGGVDVLVNNAGVMESWGDGGWPKLFDMPTEIFERTLAANLHGPVRMCQLLVPGMVRRGHGRVVNVSSGMGQFAEMGGGHAAYRISKAALNALTVVLANEVKGSGVLVNAVCPGWVRTDMGGPGAPRDVAEGADTIVWLATLPAGGPTGQFFRDRKPIAW
ncbi:MAG TPA: SDR family oxidoreductase [bacterium]|nr:SDR family oxidoreductase [bacterium]